jgi:hypothetical protein
MPKHSYINTLLVNVAAVSCEQHNYHCIQSETQNKQKDNITQVKKR